MNMGNLWRLSDAEARSISPENFDGAKGKGGMATLEEERTLGCQGIGTGLEGKPIYHHSAGRDIYHCRH